MADPAELRSRLAAIARRYWAVAPGAIVGIAASWLMVTAVANSNENEPRSNSEFPSTAVSFTPEAAAASTSQVRATTTPSQVPGTPKPQVPATPAPSTPLVIEDCDADLEAVIVRNHSAEAVDLVGWLIEDAGATNAHRFSESTVIEPGAAIRLLSGDNDPAGSDILWTREHVWNNDGDTATISKGEFTDAERCGT